ncbi:hypothetical protein COOONC_12687 [Cooperia oncophora]
MKIHTKSANAAATMDMSLDEIIAKNKREKRGGGRGFRKGFGRSGRSGGGPGGRFSGSRSYKTYIDFDAPPVAVRGPKIGGSSNPNKTVRINISNLAPSVVSSDLEELFVNYRIEAATVNYNDQEYPLRHAVIFIYVEDFKGVALDGQVMRMVLVDGGEALTSRVQLAPLIAEIVMAKEVEAEGTVAGQDREGDTKKVKRDDSRARMTEAELDAELEAYMSKPRAQ